MYPLSEALFSNNPFRTYFFTIFMVLPFFLTTITLPGFTGLSSSPSPSLHYNLFTFDDVYATLRLRQMLSGQIEDWGRCGVFIDYRSNA